MNKMNIDDYANTVIHKWIDNQVTGGRSFPDSRDGLKLSTRSILQVTHEMTEGGKKRVKMEPVLGEVANIKEGSNKNHQQILYRMSLGEFPLVRPVNESSSMGAYTIDILTGFESLARYIEIMLTDLGRYVTKYSAYFKEVQSPVDSTKWIWGNIRTPLPLSLIIPQINLADGISNSAPNLNLLEVIDAFIEHLKKDKQTTTQDLAQHISGFGLGSKNVKLYSNQSIRDLIELGIAKGTELATVEFFNNEYIVRGLPFKTFGKTIHKDIILKAEQGSKGDPKGTQTHVLDAALMEGSGDDYISVRFRLLDGSTLNDMRSELYRKTKLRNTLVYRNIVNDFSRDKGSCLTVMSVREVLDYHYNEAIELKTLEIQDDIKSLRAQFGDAIFMEKVTKRIVADIIKSVTTSKRKKWLAMHYLTNARDIFDNYINGDGSLLKDAKHIRQVVEDWSKILVEQYNSSKDQYNSLAELMEEELPNEWKDHEIDMVFTEKFAVLYKLDKRDEFIEFIQGFKNRLAKAEKRLEFDNVKKEIIEELEVLKIKNSKSQTNNWIALPTQERENIKQLKRKAMKEVKTIPHELPVNVFISSDGYARLSFYPSDDLANLSQVFMATVNDVIVVVNREGYSQNIPVHTLTIEPQKIFNPENADLVTIRNSDYSMGRKMIIVTNKGRITCVNDTALKFSNQKVVQIPLADEEYIVFAKYISQEQIDRDYVVVMKDHTNQYKGILSNKLSVKNSLIEFYNLYSGQYVTNTIDTVAIIPFDTFQFSLWNNGWSNVDVNKLTCRNVSNPIKSPLDLAGDFVVGRTFSWNNSRPIYNLQSMSNDQQVSTITAPFGDTSTAESDDEATIADLSELRIINVESTFYRVNSPVFNPTEIQRVMVLSKYQGGQP